jgi:hypothetical protein
LVLRDKKPTLTLKQKLSNGWLRLQREWRYFSISQQIKKYSKSDVREKPVAFFNASTRLGRGLSQNATFSLLAAWGIQLANVPVVHFVCHSGMSRCVLGTNIEDISETPPCERCITQSKKMYRSAEVHWFKFHPNLTLDNDIETLSVDELSRYQLIINDPQLSIHNKSIPLGELVLPALRWVLRRHHLLDDDTTRFLFRAFIQSALNIAIKFDQFLSQVDPRAVVIFNGIMYPEAVARWVAKQRNLRAITHEVGFQPFSGFFTEGQATAYPMHIPKSFELSEEENLFLDEALSQRFKGEFTMAGIRFWPKMSELEDDFLKKASQFKQIVPVFTNVINDTSQVHASTVFSDMYDWLNHVVEVIRKFPETLFVIRAHPDEKRPGKRSRQAVSDWISIKGIDRLPNVNFVDANESLSSYELIQKSKFVIVFNSSIGLEAALLGIPVLCGGKARYTQYPTVFFPQTPEEYQNMAVQFLVQKIINIPDDFIRNARRVIYWQFYRYSLSFSRYIHAHPTPGYVQLSRFSWRDLLASNSITMNVLVNGILHGGHFILPDSRHP